MNFTAERFFGDVESADPDLREMALSDLEKCLSSQEGKTLFASKWPAMVEKVLFRMSAEEQNYSVRQKSVGAIPRIIVASDPDTQQTILSRLLEMAVSPSQDVRDSARRSLERGSNAIAEQSAANIVFWQAEVCVVHNFLQKIERCAEREENDFVFAYVRTLADQFGRVCKSLLSRIMMLALRGFKNGKLDYNVSSCVTAMIAFVDSKTRSSVFLSIAEAFQRDETFPNGSTLLGALATLDAPFVSGESEKFVGFLQNVDYSAKAGNVVLAAVKLLRVLTTKCDLSTDTKDTLTSRLLTVYSAQSEAATSQAQNADASSDSEYECYDYYDDNDGADSDANLIKAEILLLMQNVCANDASAVCATVMKALQDNDDSVAKAALELLKKIDVTPLLKESALPAVLQGLFARNSDVALAALSAIGHLAALHPDKPSLASEPVAKAIIGFMKGDKWSLQEESLNTTCSVLASLGKCGGTLEIGAPLCECVAECLSQSTLAKLETKAAEVFPTVIDYVNAEGSESLAVKCVAVCKSRVLTNNTLPVQNRLEIVKSFVRNTAGSSNSPFLRPAANAASFELLLLCLKEPHLCHIVPDVLSTVSCAKFAELVSPEQSASLVEVLHETSLASRRCAAATLRILAERKMTLADGAKARCLAASFTETELFSEIVALWWTLLTNQIMLAESFPPSSLAIYGTLCQTSLAIAQISIQRWFTVPQRFHEKPTKQRQTRRGISWL
ncbi:hypothetical protein ADEAN_000282900 [Angomonas deanei]|uniref:Uncharacterized protein n=1 Tax=Angomonas deanei TaxID=59799 RepID=A0A7G2C8E2_9TRYP|nr:hypothetical protein ADEAN_000282900 [Angomonas deanei]